MSDARLITAQAQTSDDLFPIYIASKNRRQGKTMQILREEGIPFTLFVEPQDFESYREFFSRYKEPTVNVIPGNDRGLPFVRQIILSEARAWHKEGIQPSQWFWLLDDDIDGFFISENRKTGRTSARAALAGAQRLFADIPDVAQAGLEYQQFAWSATKGLVFNSYCDVAVCINVERTRLVSFRPETDLKCDRDFTLQVIAQGYRVAKVQRYSFSAPKNGSNAGGLKEAYEAFGREEASSRVMCDLWPGVCAFKPKPDGRPDVKIKWRALRAGVA